MDDLTIEPDLCQTHSNPYTCSFCQHVHLLNTTCLLKGAVMLDDPCYALHLSLLIMFCLVGVVYQHCYESLTSTSVDKVE